MSHEEDNEHLRATLCAEIQARYGSCESTARGSCNEPAGAAGSLTLSNGAVVRYRVYQQIAGIWVASDDARSHAYAGWGRTRTEAIDDLRAVLEGMR